MINKKSNPIINRKAKTYGYSVEKMDDLEKKIKVVDNVKEQRLCIDIVMQGKRHRKHIPYAKCGKVAAEDKAEAVRQVLLNEFTVNWD